MQGLWAKTAACGFRMTERTPPGRYGLPFGNRDRLALYPPAACECLSQGRSGGVVLLRRTRGSDTVFLSWGVRTCHRTLPREWHMQAAPG